MLTYYHQTAGFYVQLAHTGSSYAGRPAGRPWLSFHQEKLFRTIFDSQNLMRNYRPFLKLILLVIFVFAILPLSPIQAAPHSAATLILVAPSACPAAGCAAGQRLSYRLDFELGAYIVDTNTTDPNFKVCAYAPAAWTETGTTILDTTGQVTNQTYTPSVDTDPDPNIDNRCSQDTTPPAGYALIAANETDFNGYYFFDSLGLSLRIANNVTLPGNLLLRVFERNASGWSRTQQVFTPLITVARTAGVVYVAPSASVCDSAGATPCYLNSSGDLALGIGTGLRDAVDAVEANAAIRVLGSYAIKGNSVTLNKPIILEGQSSAALTSESTNCANPVLELSAAVTIRNLSISDGVCSTTNRSLLWVNNSSGSILIESNNLSGGSDAIAVTNNNTTLTVRYNNINSNSGYALLWTGGSGALDLLANNISGNRPGDSVECGVGEAAPIPGRKIDHNYWGGSAAPGPTSHCASKPNKQLGAPIAAKTTGPGVQVERINVTTVKTYYFDNKIALQRSSEGGDYPLYLINHGSSAPDGIPFTGTGAGSPNPCSNAYDIFLTDGAAASGPLSLSLKYNRSSACVAVIESSFYCEQTTNSARYPLWWFHPSGSVTAGWDTTGQNPAGSGASGATGQETVCDMALDEIKVNIDGSGRPNLTDDLNFTPFIIGIGIPATFRVLASDKTVTAEWTTTSEADITGYYLERSLQSSSGFGPISDLIQRYGSALSGGSYVFTDGGRTNGVTNYYRLRIMRSDGGYFYSETLPIIPNVATITPTPTPSSTFTPSLAPTRTQPWTATFRPQPSPTRRATVVIAPPTLAISLTPTRTATFFTMTLGTPGTPQPTGAGGYPEPEFGTVTPTVDPTPTPEGFNNLTALPDGSGSLVTLTPSLTVTPSPTPDRAEQMRETSRWISLVLGMLLSGGMIGLFAWIIFRRKIKDPDETLE